MLALTAAATRAIRIGSGAVQLGHRTALSVVEEFGLIDALHPGRLDLGLGRSGGRPPSGDREPAPVGATQVVDGRAPNGLRIPPRFRTERLFASPRSELQKKKKLLLQPGAHAQDYGEQVDDILALLRGSYRSAVGVEAHAVPGEGADVQVWILGSSGGQSAGVAGSNGLRFAANYHASPATVLEAVEDIGPHSGLPPSLTGPMSASPLMRRGAGRGSRKGAGSRLRPLGAQHQVRCGRDCVPDPGRKQGVRLARRDQALVADRVDTQFVGSAQQVASQLEQLQEATGADELIITTITHDHADRVRSYQLLAQEWERRRG